MRVNIFWALLLLISLLGVSMWFATRDVPEVLTPMEDTSVYEDSIYVLSVELVLLHQDIDSLKERLKIQAWRLDSIRSYYEAKKEDVVDATDDGLDSIIFAGTIWE